MRFPIIQGPARAVNTKRSSFFQLNAIQRFLLKWMNESMEEKRVGPP
jgi:hypothetical protein